MENEKIMAVFSELLENQKEISRGQKENLRVLHELKSKMDGIESQVKNQKPVVTPVDIKPIQQSLERGITEIKLSIHAQLKNTEQSNWRIFLETDAKKWAVYLVVTLTFLTYLYYYLVR